MLQNQLCENININNEDFNILDATMVEKDPILAAYFNSRPGQIIDIGTISLIYKL
ncbi:MAG: hypothetical protein AB3P11_04465 [Wolbachia pipientis]